MTTSTSTPTVAFDLSKVPHLEARKLIAKHFDSASEDQAPETKDKIKALYEQIEKIRSDYWQQIKAAVAPLEAEIAALDESRRQREQKRGDDVDAALKALGVEFEDFDLHDDYCGVNCCAVTGLALMHGDETGESPDGDPFLFCILEKGDKE